MTGIPSRVTQCFTIVFPGLTSAEIPHASQGSLAAWDSVAHVTLLSAIAEEFQFELEEDFLESVTSYAGIVEYVKAHTSRNS